MDETIQLVSLTIADYDEIVALWERAHLTIRLAGRDSRLQLQQQLKSGAVWLVGAWAEGALVGVVMPSHDSRRGWINRLAVDPAYQHQGIGEALVREAQQELWALGINVISANIERTNTASLALARECGFEVYEDVVYASCRTSTDA